MHDPLVDWARGGSSGGGRANDEGTDNPHAKDALATIEGGCRWQEVVVMAAVGGAWRQRQRQCQRERCGLRQRLGYTQGGWSAFRRAHLPAPPLSTYLQGG